jgi:hypothetical protein
LHNADLGLVRWLYATNAIMNGNHIPMDDKAIPPVALATRSKRR